MRKPFDDFDAEERELVRRSGLDKVACPPWDRVLAAQAGVLEEAEGLPLRRHVENCRFCQALCADFAAGESGAATDETRKRIRARMNRQIVGTGERVWWRQWRWWSAVAGAMACLALAVGLRRDPVASPKPAAVAVAGPPRATSGLRLEAPPVKLSAGAMTWRGDGKAAGTEYLKELGVALAPYRGGDYAAAARELGRVSGKYPESAEAAFYLGVSLLFLEEPEQARRALARAEALRPEALRDEVQYFIGVAWARNGDTGQAAARLRPLCGGAGPYREKACTALSQLR
jgi:tetratricopeptide (TPR) repeat protein